MAGDNFSSSNRDISIPGGRRGPQVSTKALLGGMTKDVKKRWMIVGSISVVAISGIAGVMSSMNDGPRTKVAATPAVTAVDTTPKGLSNQTDWRAQTGAELLALQRKLDQSTAAQAELLARVTQMQQELSQVKSSSAKSPVPGTSVDTGKKIDLTLPPPPAPPRINTGASAPPAPPATVSSIPQGTNVAPAPIAPTAAAPVPRRPAKAFIPESTATAQDAAAAEKVTEDLVPNEKKGLLPAGSFAEATLISGVEAFTGGTAQAQPQPVVLRLDANAILPNAASYQIKGCHVLASVWGDMSSERVFGRLATLTCVDANNKLVLSEEVEGTLVDSDGKNGVRGDLQDRQGAKLARSLLAGFAQGVASAFGAAQGTVSTTAFGTTTSVLSGDMAKMGAYNGASTAAEQLADFYLKQAEATMPVIAVDAGRRVSVLFTRSTALSYQTTGTYRVEPQKRMTVERPAP